MNFFAKREPKNSYDEHKKVAREDYESVEIICDFFKNETGISFEQQKEILKSKLTTFCRQREIPSFVSLLSNIKENYALKEELINYLTTNESFFYREFRQIEELVGKIKKSASKHSEILCAPCATGEEPYSIAIALLEANIPKESFKIVGIDINSEALRRAQEANYSQKSIKNLPQETMERYFVRDGQRYALKDEIKKLVDFRMINIFDDLLFTLPKFDYIFCRNMLIYFDKETKIVAKERLKQLLKESSNPIFFGHADLF